MRTDRCDEAKIAFPKSCERAYEVNENRQMEADRLVKC